VSLARDAMSTLERMEDRGDYEDVGPEPIAGEGRTGGLVPSSRLGGALVINGTGWMENGRGDGVMVWGVRRGEASSSSRHRHTLLGKAKSLPQEHFCFIISGGLPRVEKGIRRVEDPIRERKVTGRPCAKDLTLPVGRMTLPWG